MIILPGKFALSYHALYVTVVQLVISKCEEDKFEASVHMDE